MSDVLQLGLTPISGQHGGIKYASPGTLDVPTRQPACCLDVPTRQQAGNTDRQTQWAYMQHLTHARGANPKLSNRFTHFSGIYA